MASFDEAFKLPLSEKLMMDVEKSSINVFARGSYVSINDVTEKPKINPVSDLRMYNK